MKVIIKKQIHGEFASASSKDTWLKKEIELPFAPFKGLEIYLGDRVIRKFMMHGCTRPNTDQ
jgi:hypothetical protein